MDHSTREKVIEESAWRRHWFRLQHATLCLKKAFWFRVWQESAVPFQVAEGHDTLLVHREHGQCAGHPELQTGSLSCQTSTSTVDGRSGHGNLLWRRIRAISNHAISSTKRPDLLPKLQCRSSCHPELLRPHRKGWPLCGDIILPEIAIIVSEWFLLRVWQGPCRNFRLVFNVVTMLRTHKRHLLFNSMHVEDTVQQQVVCDTVVQVWSRMSWIG